MFVEQIGAAIDGARGGLALDHLSGMIWKCLAAGALNDDDAQHLAELIHAKRKAGEVAAEVRGGHFGPLTFYPPRKPQRAPLRPVSIARRRQLASSAPLPPALASRFTVGELAVLRIVADEHRDKGACLLDLQQIAARAGVCRSLAKKALRIAQSLGLVSIQERRRRGQKNLPNVVKVIDPAWLAWMRRGPRSGQRLSDEGIGVKKSAPTDTAIRSKVRGGIPPSTSDRQRGHESNLEHPKKGIRLSRGGSGEGSEMRDSGGM